MSDSDRILLVGCTSRPCADRLDQKGMSDFFEHKLWINFPDYESRRVLWQGYLRSKGVTIPTLDTAKLSVLAEVSRFSYVATPKSAVRNIEPLGEVCR